MAERWVISIDIEGFGFMWPQGNVALGALRELMRGIFRIGTKVYPGQIPNCEERLFAYQFGDGFIVASDYHENSLERCMSIAIALIRHVTKTGLYARVAVSEGALSDIQNCYPQEVLNNKEGGDSSIVGMEGGLMTIVPTMGQGLINAYGLAKKAKCGPLLVIENDKDERIGAELLHHMHLCDGLLYIDWIHPDYPLLTQIQRRAQLHAPSANELERRLLGYCSNASVPTEWTQNAYRFLGLSPH